MIGKRYDVLSELGRSSMGVVYLATDRLTGTRVALRLVTAPLVEPEDGGEPSEDRLELSRQLRHIASLRHPNIVGVVDYGFDEEMRPYYTQKLIEQPRELFEAGRGQPFEARLDLVLQTLQGLTYLHRRGVVHGDLRPRTVLVEERAVRLVNFGLSALREAEEGAEAPYLAPELLRGESASPATDLYAVGMLTYELLSGHPARDSSAVRDGSPEISTRDFDGALVPVLEKLLAEEPADRYSEAGKVIHDLTGALGRPLPEETAAIRRSFLEGARLVGREADVERLDGLLTAVLRSRGDALVVAGESGVGKSRLLEELRAMSLAEGALVLAGSAIAEGFVPYHSWRRILSHLLLTVDVDDREAAVLERHVPGLLDLEVEPVPDLDPQAARQRFVEVARGLFGRLERPAVIILEDLHWVGSESLHLWLELARSAENLPLLLVGSYRDDERPDLAMVLSEVPQLKLGRLGREAVCDLAESMLGPPGRDQVLVELLERETGGNAFFLVEVVRALAEEAGRLDRIDPSRLPEQITTGGIRRVVERRLERLPKRVRPLLRLAAVAGREIDLELLAALDEGFQARLWLRFCADQAVLEVDEGRWRFANESYREALLDGLRAAERRAAHRQVAEAIAAVHGVGEGWAPLLAHHWAAAADVSDPEATGLAVDYLERAGHAATASCAHAEASRLLNRGLRLLGTLPGSARRVRQEIRFQLDLGGALIMSLGFTAPEVGQAFARARELSESTGDSRHRTPALLGLWRFHCVRAELETCRQLAEEMARHARSSRRPSRRLLAEYALGTTILFQGEPDPAAEHLGRGIDLFAKLEADSQRAVAAAAFYLGQNPVVAALGYSGWATWCLGYPDHAQSLDRRALALADDLGHSFSQAFARLLATWQHQLRGDPEATREGAVSTSELSREQGYPYFLTLAEIFHGWARARLGEVEEGVVQIREGLGKLRAAGSDLFQPHFEALLAEACGLSSRPDEGLELLAAALGEADRCGSGFWSPELHRLRGDLYLSLPRPNRREAERCFRRALEEARTRRERSLELRALSSLTRLWEEDDERSREPRAALDKLYRGFSEGFDTPDLVAARRLL
ncbi:MAG: AAA family ATPase [bacterium]|nr:AAA family ATPase [bacterium]